MWRFKLERIKTRYRRLFNVSNVIFIYFNFKVHIACIHLSNIKGKSVVHVRALTYCDIHTINVEKLKEVLPTIKSGLRFWRFIRNLKKNLHEMPKPLPISGPGVLPSFLSHILKKPLPLLRPFQTDSLFQGNYVGDDADSNNLWL